ncbi:unnamed protein product [Plutella xylostella]|uniref:(diamondback moth) hypothetical protein n=1 Tax=Plutella xylostella TaxID=51655 RepID=A0A8S4FFS9_PLUXY|nr:unnamed protein product [Plutella xylostella]
MSRTLLLIGILQVSALTMVHSAKQQLSLSESYLPVAMQVIAHLTDQMSYATQADEPAKPKPTAKPTQNKPTASPFKPMDTPVKPTGTPVKPMDTPVKPASFPKPTTQKPAYESTTQPHRPGLYAPLAPPKPNERVVTKDFLLPIDQNSQYTVIAPKPKDRCDDEQSEEERVRCTCSSKPKRSAAKRSGASPHTAPIIIMSKPLVPKPKDRCDDEQSEEERVRCTSPNDRPTEEPLLSIEDTEIKPLVEPKPDSEPLLPPHFAPSSRTSEDILLDDEGLSDEGLQYLSPTVARGARGEIKAGPSKLSTSSLRLLLLYDLLSRDAKKQRLNDYSGFSDTVIRELATSSNGGAASQLAFALKKMLDRQDCTHEYANNRAREMITELAMNESKLTSEIRNLQPLVYKV